MTERKSLAELDEIIEDIMTRNPDWAKEVENIVTESRMRNTITRERAREHVRPGWHGLVDEAFDLIDTQPDVEVLQVKEKFGQLRIYTRNADADFYSKIWEIEERSATVCEFCGAPSQIQSRGGWLKSICDPCKEKLDVQSKKRK